jgi:hypothetical protein
MDYKSQAVQDISIRIHSIKDDGTDNTGDAANLSTVILDPAGNELIGITNYTEATFDEIGTTGVYECLFPSAVGNKVFTSVDQDNPYTISLISSTGSIGASSKSIRIVSRYIWELPTVAEIWANTTRTLTSFGTLTADMARVLGLVMENLVEEVTGRDSNGNKLTSTIYIYDSAANATTHDKATGLVASYDISASYTNNLMDLFKSIKAS